MSKEIQQIIKQINSFAPNEKAILATVVDVVGSGYRRPGARMLIDANGYAVGTVSGGCLEADVLERAKKVLESGAPTVITYDTTQDENSVFGLSMGCRGIVRILLEKVTKESRIIDIIADKFTERSDLVIVTLINKTNADLHIGDRLFLNDAGIISSNFDSEEFVELERIAWKALTDEESYVTNLSMGEVFVETIKPPLELKLFGAGYDALPLIKFAKELGWRVTAIDHRAAFANAERLPEADEIIVSASEDLNDALFQDENSVAVIMTHNYERDRNILRRLLSSKCLYVGALGPKNRTEKLLEEIGENFSGEQLARLHAPIGLDIGADSPEAIALAIVAEIQAVLNDRSGEFLRNRSGSIYARND